MDSTQTLLAFFGWLTVVYVVIYIVSLIAWTVFRGFVLRSNARLFAVSEQDVLQTGFRSIAMFKLGITLFGFGPYLALRIIS